MLKINITDPKEKEKEYWIAMREPLIKRINLLSLSLEHLLGYSKEIDGNGIASYQVMTREIIYLIEKAKPFAATDFEAPRYLATITNYVSNPNKLSNFKMQEILDFLLSLISNKATLLRELVTCPAEKLLKFNNEIEKKYEFKEIELKILALAISYSDAKLSEVSKKFFRKHNFVITCPYCNLESTDFVPDDYDGTSTVHQLDHFFNKAKYPILSLSMYNLVPSGPACNGINNKGEINFDNEFHLNPYIDGFNGYVKFIPCMEGKTVTSLDIRHFTAVGSVRYKQIIGDDTDTSPEKKKKGNMNVFKLKSKYKRKLKMATQTIDLVNKRVNGLRSNLWFIEQMAGIDLGKAHKTWYEREIRTDFEPEMFADREMSKFNRDMHDHCIANMKSPKINYLRKLIEYK